MTEYSQLLKDLKNKIYHPLYLLHGEEPYYIDRVADYIEQNLLNEGEKAFNQTVLYGRDSNAITLLDTLRRYPMMSNYQLVLLKEAQAFKDLDKLESYFENPMKSTVFVLCYKYKSLDKRTRAYKLFSKGVVLESKKLYDNQVPAFIEQLAKEMKMSISGDAVQLLAEYLGNDLSKIMNEVEKLGLNLRDVKITPQHIEKYIGISKEYNVFEFIKALVQRDKSKAFRIVKYFERNPKSGEPIMVLGMLYSFFSKALVVQSARRSPYDMMSELQLRKPMADDLKVYQSNYKIQDTVRILHLLHEYDLKTKGVDFAGSEKTVLITELAYRILN
ncbi:MAG: DNA polymerase III subunit delta [Chitinophagales bacterium]|nr:DNA polymerase III subunit delta [Chitinophagales bacterium]